MLPSFCISILAITSITRSQSTTKAALNYCVGPLVPSTHVNPIQKYGTESSECALSCDSGSKVYGLSSSQQELVDFVTIIGTILCLFGLILLSVNLYLDNKTSDEKFSRKPILFHIPYIITISTFILTLLMSISLIIGKESVICYENELTVWNPGYGKSITCSIFSVLFYSSLMYYQLYVFLLSFIVWRQFKNPLNPLWNTKKVYWHLGPFLIVLILNTISLATSAVDAVEPMGVCIPGPAEKMQLFYFVVLPLMLTWVLSAIFLTLSAVLVKKNIVRNKDTVNRSATVNMMDLLKRIQVYGFGVLFTLGLLSSTGFMFWLKHDRLRNGLRLWINCEVNNYFTPDIYGLDQNCDSLRNDDQKISPFYFMSWIISCFLAISAQLILSFHSNARRRAADLKEKTVVKITSIASPRRIKTRLSVRFRSNIQSSEYESAPTASPVSPAITTQQTTNVSISSRPLDDQTVAIVDVQQSITNSRIEERSNEESDVP